MTATNNTCGAPTKKGTPCKITNCEIASHIQWHQTEKENAVINDNFDAATNALMDDLEIVTTAKAEIRSTLVPTVTITLARQRGNEMEIVKHYSTTSEKMAKGFVANQLSKLRQGATYFTHMKREDANGIRRWKIVNGAWVEYSA